MTMRLYTDVIEVDRLIFSWFSYEDLRLLRFLDHYSLTLVNDQLWYWKIERLVGVPISPLHHNSPRLVYRLLCESSSVWHNLGWVIWYEEPGLISLLLGSSPKIVLSDQERLSCFIMSFRRADPSVLALLQPEIVWIVDSVVIDYQLTPRPDSITEFISSIPGPLIHLNVFYNALIINQIFIIEYLLQHNCDPVSSPVAIICYTDNNLHTYESLLRILSKWPDRVQSQNWRDQMLIRSIETISVPQVKLLLKYGADPTIHNYLAMTKARGQPNLIKEMVAICGEKAVRARQYLIVRHAARFGHLELLQWLFDEYGRAIDVNAVNGYAIRWAAASGYTEIVCLLLNDGADVSVKNYQPLYHATASGHLETVKLLLDDYSMSLNDNKIIRSLSVAIYHTRNHSLQLLELFLSRFSSNVAEMNENAFERLRRTSHRLGLPNITGRLARWRAGLSW